MIKGKIKSKLTVETILSRISEYDIFRHYMPSRSWQLNDVTYSPFREERNPSFLIGNKYGSLHFIDFGDTSKKGNCFQFVMMLHNCSFNDALLMIDKDFSLGIASGEELKECSRIILENKPVYDVEKRYSLIQVVVRKFTNEELAYWNQYHQDVQDLRDNNVYSVSRVYLNKKRFPMKETELRFGYFYNGNWKIYRPFSDKRSKWMPNNVPIVTIEGKENIINCDVAFINKSKKDYMVMKKVFPCTCAVQNEGMACFSEENVSFLKENSNRQILSFDNDTTGVKNSQLITEKFGFDYCNVPKIYLQEGIKDWADLSCKYGLNAIENILKQKNIL